MKKISILGSTGSIGQSTLSVVDSLNEQFQVVALASGRNLNEFVEQIIRYAPQLVSVASEADSITLKDRLREVGVAKMPEILNGEEGLVAVACYDDAEIV